MNRVTSAREPVTLYMIGHSHIDPVWFWNKEEGFQEVKATFLSALDRMEEYEEFHFTASSSAFYEYVEVNFPELFARIQKRVREGRWEIAGGWYVEADTSIPCGESLVRQALYGQRYFLSRFGRISTMGFAPDTFAHPETVPLLLKGAGMTAYVRQRPNRKSLSAAPGSLTPEDTDDPVLSNWKSKDGSTVLDFHLPAEYTAWFEDSLNHSIALSLAAAEPYGEMACFYGVGNHGGGPTIQNITHVKHLKDNLPTMSQPVQLRFSRLDRFLHRVQTSSLPTCQGEHQKSGNGCHAMDTQLKRDMRQAENALYRSEALVGMAMLLGLTVPGGTPAAFENLWKKLLFNGFHDILCGTAIQSARDLASAELRGSLAAARELENRAIQAMVQHWDTQDGPDDGFPLFFFNPELHTYAGPVEVEIPWFCKSHVSILDCAGREIPYQRVKTACTMIHRRLGGVRRLTFPLSIPPFGHAVCWLTENEPSYETATGEDWVTAGLPADRHPHIPCGPVGLMGDTDVPLIIGTDCLSMGLSPITGLPETLIGRAGTGLSLQEPMCLMILRDDGDSWGWREGELAASGERMDVASLRLLENGPFRKQAKVDLTAPDARAEILYTLYAGDEALHMQIRVLYNRPRTILSLRIPFSEKEDLQALAKVPYGETLRAQTPDVGSMQDFLDIHSTRQGNGLAVVNDGIYSYRLHDGILDLHLGRSAIFAQGSPAGWYSEHADYDYADRGRLHVNLCLLVHGTGPLPGNVLHKKSGQLNHPAAFLFDTHHSGSTPAIDRSLVACEEESLILGSVKPAEEGGVLLRFFHTGENQVHTHAIVAGQRFSISVPPHGLASYRYSGGALEACDLLEFPIE